jgi:chromosome segregation ATPase
MKNSILLLAVTVCMAGTMLTGCQSSAKKTDKNQDSLQGIKKDAADVKNDLKEMNKDLISDFQQFKKESEEKIISFENTIAEFKAKIATENKADKAKYDKEIARLEQQNSDLKKKLDDYKDDGKDQWKAFKTEFDRDMDELGKAFKDLTVDNVK